MATCREARYRNPTLAVQYGEKALELAGSSADFQYLDTLAAAYAEAGDAHSIILDFSQLDYMNSGGIGLLVTLLVRTQRAGQKLLAVGLTDHYRQILALTRLDEAIAICDDETAALAAASA
jgi:anti-sigma B factor antagonist